MIAIIDYGLGNLASITNALNRLKIPNRISDEPYILKRAQGLILPGVGAAKQGMKNIREKKLKKLIIEELKKGKPILGICLGMQLLFETSEEGNVKCLGLVNGTVKRFSGPVKIPQIGWNQIEYQRSKINPPAGGQNYKSKVTNLFASISDNSFFYFVNSYYCKPSDKSIVTGTSNYGGDFCSALQKSNIFGVQFHPEKSGKDGFKLLKNFSEICKGEKYVS